MILRAIGLGSLILVVSLYVVANTRSVTSPAGNGQGSGAPKSKPTEMAVAVTAQPQTPAPSCLGWDAPLVGAGGQLSKLAVVSPSDVWAVGYVEVNNFPYGGDSDGTLAEHWDGVAWSAIPIGPPITGTNSYLTDVSAASSHDVWSIGYYTGCTNQPCTGSFAEHWDGAQWSVPPDANIQNDVTFSGVAALASNDVWIVGSGQDGRAFTEHWNGTQWAVIPNAASGNSSYLAAVAGIASDDV